MREYAFLKSKQRRLMQFEDLLRTIRPLDLHPTLPIFVHNSKTPRVAAHLAVLHDAAVYVGLEVDLNLLAAVRTYHHEQGFHL